MVIGAGVVGGQRRSCSRSDPDYLLTVIVKDQAAFQQLYDEQLAALPSVQRLTSTLVMKDIVKDRP